MTSVAGVYAWVVARLRFVVVAGWVAAAVAATLFLPSLAEAEGGELGGLVPEEAEAVRAELRALEQFDVPLLARAAVVQRDPAGLSAREQARIAARAVQVTRNQVDGLDPVALALPVLNTFGLFPSASEAGTTAVTYLFFPPDLSLSTQARLADRYAELAADAEGHVVGVTGAAPARRAQGEVILEALPWIAAGTVGLVAVVFALVFRAVGAPLVALAAAGLSYFLSLRVAGWAAETFDLAAPRELDAIMLALILGIVTDYVVFQVTGVRRRLAAGRDKVTAAEETARNVGPIVATAGVIVALGIATLLVGRLGFFRALGPGLALSVLVTLAVGVTFVPALLALFGRAVYWPARLEPEEREERHDWRERLSRLSTARPVAFLLAAGSVAALLAAANGLRQLDLGFTLIEGFPPGSEIRAAADAAAAGFAPGIVAPTIVLAEGEDLADQREEFARLEQLLANRPGVAGVLGPQEQPPGAPLDVFLAADAARYALILDRRPLGAPGIERLASLRDALPRLAEQAGLEDVRFSFAGDTALADETIERIRDDLLRVGAAALLVNFGLLALFLRALVAPLYLLLASVLSLAASLGLTVYVFQGLLGYDEITYYVPFAVAVLSLSLGSDYNLFLAGRIWQESHRMAIRQAISFTAPRTRRAIATAGVTLAGSFGLLALVPIRAFREFAFAMAAGILLDTFFVRPLLVPSLIAVFGRLSWWPGTVEPARPRRPTEPRPPPA